MKKKRKTIKDVVYFINKKDKERNEKQEEEEKEEEQIEELFRVERSLRSTSGWITRLFLLDDKKKTKKNDTR